MANFNTVAGCVLASALFAMVLGKVSNALVHPHTLDKPAIAVTEAAPEAAAGAPAAELAPIGPKLAGANIEAGENTLRVIGGASLKASDVITKEYPGFATDMQAQYMALMTTADGTSRITETIFENRFMHVPELLRMGADIKVEGDTAVVRGVPRLTGAPVMATDLRASVSLAIAGLAAEGDTTLHRVYHLDRGFERLENKLRACGAQIERVSGQG